MNQIYLELGSLFLLISMLGMYTGFGLLIDYHTSFIKESYPNYTRPQIYLSIIFLDFGIVIANSFVHRLIGYAGITKTLQLGGNLAVITCTLMIFFTNIFTVYFAYLMTGVVYQIYTFCTIYFLGSKFKDKMITYSGYVFSGSSVSYLIWGVCGSFLINPTNESQNVKSGDEMIFPHSVSARFPIFCCIYGFANILTAFGVGWILSSGETNLSEGSLVLSQHQSSLNFSIDERNKILNNMQKKARDIQIFMHIFANKKFYKSKNINFK